MSSDPFTGIIIGSIIFLVVGIIAYCFIDSTVKKNFENGPSQLSSKRTLYLENRGTVITSVIIGTIGMWIMWVTCYMHQMYPLITPVIHH